MSKRIFLKQFILAATLLSVVLIQGCGKSARSVSQKAQSLIDHKKYAEAVSYIESELASHPNRELKTQLGYAYLGLAGIELLEIASKIKALKNLKSIELGDLDTKENCDHSKRVNLSFDSVSIFCYPTINIPGFENAENQNLLKAIAVLSEANPNPETSSADINLLLALVHLGTALGNYNLLAAPPEKFFSEQMQVSRALKMEAATYTLKNAKRMTNNIFLGFKRLINSYGKIQRFFNQYEGKPLFTVGSYTYYVNRNMSAEDLFSFMVNSAKSEGDIYLERAKKQKSSALNLSGQISRALYFLRLDILDGNEGFLGDAYWRLVVLSGSHFLPNNYRINPNAKMPELPSLDADMFPNSAKKVFFALKDSWNTEDSSHVFDALDFMKAQTQIGYDIFDEWDYFFLTLSQTGKQKLKAEVDEFQSRVPMIKIDPKQKIDSVAIKAWYYTWARELKEWKTHITERAQLDADFENLQQLLEKTEAWADLNLYTI